LQLDEKRARGCWLKTTATETALMMQIYYLCECINNNSIKLMLQFFEVIGQATKGQAHMLYDSGADYVLRMAKLCAERLQDLLVDHTTHTVHHHMGDEDLTLPGHTHEAKKNTDGTIVSPKTNVFQNYRMGDDDKHLDHIKV
jgi:predicted MPP superfamily phosphohydrolase